MTSNYLGCEADDLHKSSLAQFTRDRSKNTRADRLVVWLYDDRGVLIETDVRPVLAPSLLSSANHDRADDLSLFNRSVRRRFFYGSGNHIAQSGARAGVSPDWQNH